MEKLETPTCGGARLGNCAIGSVGIAAAPARIISSAHTVANTGRRMKKSTNIEIPNHGAVEKSTALVLENLRADFQLCGITGAPSSRNCVPETITLSPGLRPSWTS